MEVLHDALIGPAAQLFDQANLPLVRDLTQRVGSSDWRYGAVTGLAQGAAEIGIEVPLGARVSLKQFFDIGVSLRNRTKGHGAPTVQQCALCCPRLATALSAVDDNLELFRASWVHIHQNLSGKYRVSPPGGETSPFDYLKRERQEQLPNGVYLYSDRPVRVPLVYSDPDLLDVALPNGNYTNGSFETLSYVTNEVVLRGGSTWSDPPLRLPRSETRATVELESLGGTLATVPQMPRRHIPRRRLEERVRTELLDSERHPIVSLTGSGGVGKTTVAIAAIHDIANEHSGPYDVILWISARDIDLLESGPRPVSPDVKTEDDIARAAILLLEGEGQPIDRLNSRSTRRAYFEDCLQRGAGQLPTLFVLDNFETLQNPSDAFKWIDAHIRPPNKALITTRVRSFVGDYPIEIAGMADGEAEELVEEHARHLDISGLLTKQYKEELIREAEGHPYVMKILLGEVAKEGKARSPERIMASSDDLLRALFERTYSQRLSAAGQRVFLLLCSWRVVVPEVAVEAVSLRPGAERYDVAGALDELERYSLAERLESGGEDDGEGRFVGVPLVASLYGRQKLNASPFKAAIDEDRKLLMEFGAGGRSYATRGVLPRIENLLRAVARRASERPESLEESLPILEYLARRVPKAYVMLADLVKEVDDSPEAMGRAIGYLTSYVEVATVPRRLEVWLKLAELHEAREEWISAMNALSEAALSSMTTKEDVSRYANRLNNLLRDLRRRNVDAAWSGAITELIQKVIDAMERRLGTLDATGCSRLAWLYLNNGNPNRAYEIARIGLGRDETNEHCRNLMERLGP